MSANLFELTELAIMQFELTSEGCGRIEEVSDDEDDDDVIRMYEQQIKERKEQKKKARFDGVEVTL